MASSVSLGYPMWCDGMEWTSLLSRQYAGSAAVWDTNASASLLNPLGGVYPAPGKPLGVAQQASPAMSVLVDAGYCAVAHPTQGHGVYLFGLLSQGTLTVAANSSGQARVDIVVARVYDEDSSGSYADVEILEGTPGSGQPATPSASLLLAAVAVANGATSIGTANITDKRTFTVAPGGIIPAAAASPPSMVAGQVMWDTTSSILQRAAPPVPYGELWDEPGSYTWTSPFTGTVRVQAKAPGGGGSQTTEGAEDGSGGGGEYAEEPAYPVILDHVYDIAINGGGTGGYDGAGPSPGTGPTTFDGTGVVAHPGQGGKASTGGGTGLGGTGSTNTIHFDGGSGTISGTDPPQTGGAGGGSSAGPLGPGADGDSPEGSGQGQGGQAPPGGGNGGYGGSQGVYGANGESPGGGGGASGDGGGEILIGGAGGNGQLLLTWVITPGTLAPLASADIAETNVDTSTGSSGSAGLNAGLGSAYGWGIGYGATTDNPGEYWWGGGSGFDADGTLVQQIEAQFTADGMTDFQISARYGMAVPEAAVDASSPSIASGQCRVLIMLDGTILDTVYLRCAASGGVTQPGDAGEYSVYTSAILGTTPSAGSHTASLAIETMHTSSGQLSGAHVGNLASVAQSTHPFGSVPSYFYDALTAENCSIRVASLGTTL